jgi:hypothetical protein
VGWRDRLRGGALSAGGGGNVSLAPRLSSKTQAERGVSTSSPRDSVVRRPDYCFSRTYMTGEALDTVGKFGQITAGLGAIAVVLSQPESVWSGWKAAAQGYLLASNVRAAGNMLKWKAGVPMAGLQDAAAFPVKELAKGLGVIVTPIGEVAINSAYEKITGRVIPRDPCL